ncbi:MAG: Druantia anti-phage system protein DruA [Methanosarcinaceae archaeon]
MKISQENIIIRGREFRPAEIDLIKAVVSSHSDLSRRKLSILICKKLDWRQVNDNLKDRACRDVLIRLNNQGIITLPKPISDFTTQSAGVKQIDFSEPSSDITGTPKNFPMPVFHLVRNNEQRNLWNYLVDRYHYKGCRIVVGRHLKYLIYSDQQLIGCFGFADAVLQLKSRDEWIGWDEKQRQANLHLIINNVRFLILPWVKIKYLASMLLGLSAKIVPAHWQKRYNYRPLVMETFVEKQRFSGASYKAANWIYLGQTRGKGRSGMNYYQHGIIKDVYVYPLMRISGLRKLLKSGGTAS